MKIRVLSKYRKKTTPETRTSPIDTILQLSPMDINNCGLLCSIPVQKMLSWLLGHRGHGMLPKVTVGRFTGTRYVQVYCTVRAMPNL